ncbi:MAG: RHS repeat-associated core domain-containing protein, partial [Planctomycetes bacterium]|nr:RHS repeat-associated core domain-containing protein [Planctomycetota bacterium]
SGQATGETTVSTWDHRNRLTHLERRSNPTSAALVSADYTYDVFDRRIGKKVVAGAAPVEYRESYVYDGDHIVIEYRDPDGDAGPQPLALSTRRLYGPVIDQILAEETYPAGGGNNSTVLWPLADWQGSVRDLVQFNSSTGQPFITKHIDYDSFGRVIGVTNGSGQPSTLDSGPSTRLGYTGREFDSETGLQYNRARYYDAAIGRWLSEDPIGFSAGDPNLYRYVRNNPENSADPSGLQEAMSKRETDRFRAAGNPSSPKWIVSQGRSVANLSPRPTPGRT